MRPSQYIGVPAASRISTQSSLIQRTVPSRWIARYSIRNGSPVSVACSLAATTRSRSSGCTRSTHA